jgi:hypothetical protein
MPALLVAWRVFGNCITDVEVMAVEARLGEWLAFCCCPVCLAAAGV